MGMDLLSTKDGRGIYTGAGTYLTEFQRCNSTPARKNMNVYQMRTVSTLNYKPRNLIHVYSWQLATHSQVL